MIKAIIFDLDGTLIQTEVLKARSYALAVHELTNEAVPVKSVVDRFKKYVGLSRLEVVAGLVEDFREELEEHFEADGDQTLGDWLLDKRLSLYEKMANDTALLLEHSCQYNLGLLNAVSQDDFKVVLATMSHLKEADKVLDILDVKDKLDFIFTRDNVTEGKPDPEIYLLAKDKLKVEADECIVIEDSVNGIKAGINAKMHVFAVTNNITHDSVCEANLLEPEFIIEDPKYLNERIYAFIKSKQEN